MTAVKNWDKFVSFVRLQLHTGDYDAHIPFLRGLVADQKLDGEKATWLGLLYMAYYTEGSMWAAFKRLGVRSRSVKPPTNLPITTQRRNLYGGRIVRHLDGLHAIRPTLQGWLSDCDTWDELLAAVGTVWGNGRWACYTTSELLTHLCDPLANIEPNSYEILASSGPRKGLAALGLEASEASAELVCNELQSEGVLVPASVLESLLCDWAGMNKGTFYAGRNIDRQQGRIVDVETLLGAQYPELWRVRQRVFPSTSLGELNGWCGINKQRLKVYRDSGAVVAPWESRVPAIAPPKRKGR